MTRNIPGSRPQEGYYSGPQDNYPPQPQYGESQYGQNPSQEGDREYNQYQQPSYGDNFGQAQSYYGANEQAYQQYPNEQQSWNQPSGQYHQGGQYPPQQTYGEQPYAAPQYGSEQQQSPCPDRPQYAEGYNQEAQHPMLQPSSEVDAFKSHFDQPSSPPSQYPPPTSQYPPGSEEDRGVMGALAGGAAGAYGGHKVHHGFLGAIGGAIGGSMLEDAVKKHHKKEEEEKHRLQNPPPVPPHPNQQSGGGNFGGNFHASSRGVHLEDRCILVAECADMGGNHRASRLDLNDCLTNTDGQAFWAKGGNFAASARNIRLTDNGNALEAELGDGRGGWVHNKVFLNERIMNEDGKLRFLHT